MTVRAYLMPTITQAEGRYTAKRGKYVRLLSNSAVIHYGPEPYCIVISDVDATQHTNVMANADVRALPANLDGTITNGTRTTIVNALEAANIPAQWVSNGMTFRVFLRCLVGVFRILQGVHGRKFRLLQAALNDPLSSLPANVRQALQEIAQSMSLDTTGITASTTLRAALTALGNQFADRPVHYSGVSL
jgi:hypothetical protein